MKEYFVSQNISANVIDLVFKNQARIEHQDLVTKLAKLLEQPLPDSLVNECKEYTKKVKLRYNENYDTAPKWCFFVPSMETDRATMEKFEW